MNVFDYLFEQSKEFDKDFVLGLNQRISFQKLLQDSICMANRIKLLVGENNKIILLSENSIFQITAYLAILKSGNICIPLNPNIEIENFDHIIKTTDIGLSLINKRHKDKYKHYNFKVLDEDFFESTDQQNYMLECDSNFDEHRLAEIIFTSGSTGEQKGVQITHKNIKANTDSIIEYLQLEASDTMEVVLPFYYCYGLSLLHTHLKVGGSIVLNNNFMFIGSVINDINKYKCTGFAGVPSHFQILLRKTRDFKATSFPSLRYVTQAGGKLHFTFITEFHEAFPNIKFYVMYGQTEATARLSYLPPEQLLLKAGSIGKGIPGVTLRVVDENFEDIKEGGTGEIIAKGDNVMAGYWNDPEETSRTIRNGWLFTGDLARIDDEGYIFIQSRKKEIIKVGGVRISPQEIEDVIVRFPGIIGCSVASIRDELLGEALKATVFINEEDKHTFTENMIKKHCATVLSTNKIPKLIVFETRLPYNSVGKKVK